MRSRRVTEEINLCNFFSTSLTFRQKYIADSKCKNKEIHHLCLYYIGLSQNSTRLIHETSDLLLHAANSVLKMKSRNRHFNYPQKCKIANVLISK